jgi:cell division protein FtsW (lipid II flippase)
MTSVRVTRSGVWQPWLVLPGALFGLFLTDFFPPIGTTVGVLALVAAAAVFFLRGPRWLLWLLVGVVVGTLILWALALNAMANPTPSEASGSGSAR